MTAREPLRTAGTTVARSTAADSASCSSQLCALRAAKRRAVCKPRCELLSFLCWQHALRQRSGSALRYPRGVCTRRAAADSSAVAHTGPQCGPTVRTRHWLPCCAAATLFALPLVVPVAQQHSLRLLKLCCSKRAVWGRVGLNSVCCAVLDHGLEATVALLRGRCSAAAGDLIAISDAPGVVRPVVIDVQPQLCGSRSALPQWLHRRRRRDHFDMPLEVTISCEKFRQREQKLKKKISSFYNVCDAVSFIFSMIWKANWR